MAGAAWHVSDGTEVRQQGRKLEIRGRTDFAKYLRGLAPVAPEVTVLPPPGGSVPLDPASTWLVDRWVRAEARRVGLEVESAYEAKDADAPELARELLAAAATWGEGDGEFAIH